MRNLEYELGFAMGYTEASADAVEAIRQLQEDSPFVRADDLREAIFANLNKRDEIEPPDTLRPDGATQ